jgi:hypothetical protein
MYIPQSWCCLAEAMKQQFQAYSSPKIAGGEKKHIQPLDNMLLIDPPPANNTILHKTERLTKNISKLYGISTCTT